VIPNRTRIDHGASGRGFRGVGAQSIQRNLRGRASAVARRWFTVAGASSASVNAASASEPSSMSGRSLRRVSQRLRARADASPLDPFGSGDGRPWSSTWHHVGGTSDDRQERSHEVAGILPCRRGDVCPGAGPRPARRNPGQWWWPWRPRVSTGVAPGRVHCGTGRLVGPQVATPSASERQYQQIGEPCPPTGDPA
jgi:hypothetical protein